jgi:hypothetical protein
MVVGLVAAGHVHLTAVARALSNGAATSMPQRSGSAVIWPARTGTCRRWRTGCWSGRRPA